VRLLQIEGALRSPYNDSVFELVKCNVKKQLSSDVEGVCTSYEFQSCWQTIPGFRCCNNECSFPEIQSGSGDYVVAAAAWSKCSIRWDVSTWNRHVHQILLAHVRLMFVHRMYSLYLIRWIKVFVWHKFNAVLLYALYLFSWPSDHH